MRIGVVDQHYFPPDRLERFRKIVATLAQAGNSVVVMCRSDGESPAVEMLDPYMLVYRFGKSSVNNLGRILSYPAPFNILWTGWIRKVICEEKLDALVVQNLRLAIPTLLAARLAGIPGLLAFLYWVYVGMKEVYRFARIAEHRWRALGIGLFIGLVAIWVQGNFIAWLVSPFALAQVGLAIGLAESYLAQRGKGQWPGGVAPRG